MKTLLFTVRLIFGMTLVLVLAACQSTPATTTFTPLNMSHVDSTADRAIQGVDVSKYQGDVDFLKLKAAGMHYVFIRATEGITYQDVDYKSNHSKAKAAGLRVGVYHFYESNDDPMAQLKNFTDLVSLSAGDLAPVIDIEKLHQNDDKNLIVNLQRFLDGLEAHYGVKSIVYTGEKFANQYLTGFGAYPLWLAEYQVDQPKIPSGWQNWTFWQWSQSGQVNGVKGNLDMDRFNGDAKRLSELLIK